MNAENEAEESKQPMCPVTVLGMAICSNSNDLYDDAGDNIVYYYGCFFTKKQKDFFDGLSDFERKSLKIT